MSRTERPAPVLIALVAVLAAAACTTTTSPRVARPTPPRAAPEAQARLTLLNDTVKDACYVYLFPTASTRRGPDWLGQNEVIRPGTERRFVLSGAGAWNVRVQDCAHRTIAERTGVAVVDGMRLKLTRIAVQPNSIRFAGTVPLRIYNDTPDTVATVLMSPAAESQWGTNWLEGQEMIPTGGERPFMVAPSDAWDIRVRDKARARLAEGRRIPILGPTSLSVSSLGR